MKRGHHYVWKHYLNAWATNSQVYCLRNGNIFPINTTKIAKERDFYRLHKLSEKDVLFLKTYVMGITPDRRLREHYFAHIRLFSSLPHMSEFASQSLKSPFEELQSLVIEAREDLYAEIESQGRPYIEFLKANDTSFFLRPKCAMQFLHYLFIQHFRTKNMREKYLHACRLLRLPFDESRVWPFIAYISATNISYSYFRDSEMFQITVLVNETDIPFITSDQPTINVLATGDSGTTHKLALYYPLSPTRAMVFHEKSELEFERGSFLNISEVQHYNELVKIHASEFIVSNSFAHLKSLGLEDSLMGAGDRKY